MVIRRTLPVNRNRINVRKRRRTSKPLIYVSATDAASVLVNKRSKTVCNMPRRELTYHMESYSVTCHPAEVRFPAFTPSQLKMVLDSVTQDGCKAELI